MRVLFVSSSPLKKEISIGNTFINLFEGMENVELASIYTRSGMPDTEISKAFCITEKMLVKNFFGMGKAGAEVEIKAQKKGISSQKENKILSFVKSRRWSIFFWIQNLIWRIGHWKSKELNTFIEEYNPDVIFTLLSDSAFLNRLILHVKDVSKAPLAVYAWDNNYSLRKLMFSPFKWVGLFLNRRIMRKVAKKADVMYVISEIQKKEYEKAFKRVCKILTKGYDFKDEAPVKAEYNTPLKLVFTGNIETNRWKTLALIAETLKQINEDEIKAQLYIYTATPLTRPMMQKLNIENCSQIMGRVSNEEVQEIQNDADILVHVEGFELKNRCLLHQSFSTKIVDYFKAARPILAVAPHDVASIDELKRHDGAMVVTDKKEIKSKLELLISGKEVLDEYSHKAYMCGKLNYNSDIMKKMLVDDLNKVTENK